MNNVKINGKEIEFDEKDIKPLPDEELESATGGLILPGGGIQVFRRVCIECGVKSPYCTWEDWYTPEASKINHDKWCNKSCIVEETHCFIP